MKPQPIGRQTFAVIDAAALRHNFSVLRGAVDSDVEILAVVKANAYGHGASIVAPILEAAGADWFGVATVGEGVELRNAGIRKPILVLTGASGGEASALIKQRLSVALLHAEMARDLSAALAGQRLSVHLKVDTGMGRLGVRPEGIPVLLDEVRRLGNLSVDGLFSHFGNADDVNQEFSNQQISAFGNAAASVAAAGFQPRWLHLANSAAAITRPDVHFSMIRPGLALYGIAPAGVAGEPLARELRPVMRMVTHILQINDLPAETPVSYGQTFVTRRPSRIAVLPIGYADGYSRGLSNRGFVLVKGERAPIVGNVCMDLTMIDVTAIPDVGVGEEVALWGAQGDAVLSIDEVAAWDNTISYEVMNRLGRRVPRLVHG